MHIGYISHSIRDGIVLVSFSRRIHNYTCEVSIKKNTIKRIINRIILCNINFLQFYTIIERIGSNACDGIWDGDGCQACAARERTGSNACDRVWDGDGREACAAREFTTYCISIDFVLNGRKVIAWILWIVKMIKF